MSETTNYKLHLTDDGSEPFLDWRKAINGTENSNMVKIDAALGGKQDKLTGAPGTVLGFDENGELEAQSAVGAYEAAMAAGYTGTEEEFYAALASLKNGPFLPVSGGTIAGDFTVTDSHWLPTDEGVFLVRPDGKYTRPDGSEGTGFAKVNVRSIFTEPVQITGGDLRVFGTITSENDIYGKSGRFSDMLYAGEGLSINGEVNIYPDKYDPKNSTSVNAEAKIYCRGVIPFSRIDAVTDGEFPLGAAANRWNTLYTKKVDATEYVETRKLQASSQFPSIRFVVRGGGTPSASPNPLPPEWGGTGLSRALTPGDIGAVSTETFNDTIGAISTALDAINGEVV